jgi:integrase
VQMRVTLRPGSMPHIERVLREFALWLRDEAPEVRAVRDLRRVHIERYKRHVAQKPNRRGGRLSKRTVAGELSTLRICLERLAEWDGEDAPARTLMSAGDVPKLDDPPPRFIDDGAAKKLIQAARATDDPFARLAVEFLARTGLRRSEFLDLKIDSVVQIGSAYWLHLPLGKCAPTATSRCTHSSRSCWTSGSPAGRPASVSRGCSWIMVGGSAPRASARRS